MKTLTITSLLVCSLFVSQAYAEQSFLIGSWEWVEPINPKQVTQSYSNGMKRMERDDTCGLLPGGKLRVLKSDGTHVIAKYDAMNQNTIGTPCPDGVLILTTIQDLKQRQEDYYRVKRETEERQKLIDDLWRK